MKLSILSVYTIKNLNLKVTHYHSHMKTIHKKKKNSKIFKFMVYTKDCVSSNLVII